MSKLYTKTGDKGYTGLIDGSRVSKSDLRIEALGSLDEANAMVGFVLAEVDSGHASCVLLIKAQSYLFTCGARVADPAAESQIDISLPTESDIREYEQSIDAMTREMPPLTRFILPGGCEAAARAHIARAVVRRAERSLVALKGAGGTIEPEIIQLLNRLSDWLFTLARYYNYQAGVPDVVWGPL